MGGHIKQVNIKEIMLENILNMMSGFTFSKEQSAIIVGGESKLLDLISKGAIECEKTSNSKNGKWFCNASQVLQHCCNTRDTNK